MSTRALRGVQRRIMITISSAVVLATVCATAEFPPPTESHAASYAVDMVAAIAETPTTIGLADSNLVRLGDEALIDQQLDMMQALGVQNVRIGISWITTQLTENGTFFWGATDYVINEAHRRGMGVLGVLHETPVWAGSPPLSGTPDLAAFGAFAGAVAEKYKGKISALEVWNEPNGRFFLNPVDPVAYTNMVKVAYAAIKAHDDPADPDDDITVVAGVLGSGRTLGDNFTMNPVDFLQGMYDSDAHGYFDAFSFHPYHYDIPFSEGAIQSDSPMLQLRQIRALMEQYGDGDLTVWASEYGLPTTPFDPDHPGLYNSPEKQSEFLADFLASWQREDGTGPIFIYSTRDLDSGSPSDQDNFGIWYTDWQPKPAVQAISDFLADLEPGNPVLDRIRAFITRVVEITGEVINDVVDVVVWGAEALLNATVWAVKTIAEVTVTVVKGIADVTSTVVHGIANAIADAANWVVTKVKSCLGIASAPPAESRTSPNAVVPAAADTPLRESRELPALDEPTEPDATAPDAEPQPAADATPQAEADAELAAPPMGDVTEETAAQDAELFEAQDAGLTEAQDAEETEARPVASRPTAITSPRTVRTVRSPRTAASGGMG